MITKENLVKELESNRDITIQLFNNVTQEQAEWKPDTERWSLLEIINHIIDIEKEDFRFNIELILNTPEADWPSFNEMEWIKSRKYNERKLNESIQNFIEERNKSIQWLKDLQNPNLFSKHLGSGLNNKIIKVGDLFSSWIGHDYFHIKHITLLKWDILRKWSEPFSPDYSGFF